MKIAFWAICSSVTLLAPILISINYYNNCNLFQGKPNIIYRKSYKTCSSSWMAWFQENLHHDYCIVVSQGRGYVFEQVKTLMRQCPKGSPIAVVDHNNLTRIDLKKQNLRNTIIIDSIRDPITRITSLCKQEYHESNVISDEQDCLSVSSWSFTSYAYPPNGIADQNNNIDFFINCDDVEKSICRIRHFLPNSLQKTVSRIKSINVRKRELSISLSQTAIENLKNITEDYSKAKLHMFLADRKISSCNVKFESKGITASMYNRYGRLK